MNKKIFGVMSLLLLICAAFLAVAFLFQISLILGITFLLIFVVSGYLILYFYCAKCPCKFNCGHIFPGKIVQKFNRAIGPYTNLEFSVTVIAIVLMIGFPQIWLWKKVDLFITYWILNLAAFIIILFIMCRSCGNIYCPLHKKNA